MNSGVRVAVALNTLERDFPFRDGALGDAARRDANLHNGTGHERKCGAGRPTPTLDVVIQRELIRMRPQANGVGFVLALVGDERLQQLFAEYIAFG